MDPSEYIVVEYIDDMDHHSPQKDLYKCPHCPKAFETPASYNRHIRTHDDRRGARKKSCKLCNYVTTIDEELTRHVELAHSQEILTLNGQRLKHKQSRDVAVECKFCGALLDTNTTYYEHAKKEHLHQVQMEWYLCDLCNSYYPEYADLLLHKNVRHSQTSQKDDNECEFCGKVFPEDYSYHKHANTAHEREVCQLWQPCDRCPMFLPCAKILSRHKVQRHFHQMVPHKKIPKTQLLEQIDASPGPKPILASPLGPRPRSESEQLMKATIPKDLLDQADLNAAIIKEEHDVDEPPFKKTKKNSCSGSFRVQQKNDGGLVYVISQSGSGSSFILPQEESDDE